VAESKSELALITEQLTTISIALSIIALNQSGAEAANADERRRYDGATQRCVEFLLARIEGPQAAST